MNMALKTGLFVRFLVRRHRCFTEVYQDGVKHGGLAAALASPVGGLRCFGRQPRPAVADQRVIDVNEHEPPALPGLLQEAADLQGYESFVADVKCWCRPIPACSAHGGSGFAVKGAARSDVPALSCG